MHCIWLVSFTHSCRHTMFFNQSSMHDYNLIKAVVLCDTENVGTDPAPNKYRPHTAGNSTNTFNLWRQIVEGRAVRHHLWEESSMW